jgi:hypothetical protein
VHPSLTPPFILYVSCSCTDTSHYLQRAIINVFKVVFLANILENVTSDLSGYAVIAKRKNLSDKNLAAGLLAANSKPISEKTQVQL